LLVKCSIVQYWNVLYCTCIVTRIVQYWNVLYCTCIVQYWNVLYYTCIVLYSTGMYLLNLYCAVLECIVLYLYCTVQYWNVFTIPVLCSTGMYCTVPVLYCTCIVLYSTGMYLQYLYCAVLECIVLLLYCNPAVSCYIMWNTVMYCTVIGYAVHQRVNCNTVQ